MMKSFEAARTSHSRPKPYHPPSITPVISSSVPFWVLATLILTSSIRASLAQFSNVVCNDSYAWVLLSSFILAGISSSPLLPRHSVHRWVDRHITSWTSRRARLLPIWKLNVPSVVRLTMQMGHEIHTGFCRIQHHGTPARHTLHGTGYHTSYPVRM